MFMFLNVICMVLRTTQVSNTISISENVHCVKIVIRRVLVEQELATLRAFYLQNHAKSCFRFD